MERDGRERARETDEWSASGGFSTRGVNDFARSGYFTINAENEGAAPPRPSVVSFHSRTSSRPHLWTN